MNDEFIILQAEEIPDGTLVTWGSLDWWFTRDSFHIKGYNYPNFQVSGDDKTKMKKWEALASEGTFYVRASDVSGFNDEDLWE